MHVSPEQLPLVSGYQPVAADRLAREGQHATLYGTALVIGRPREVVVRRCAPDVVVERLHEPVPETSRAAWLL